MKSIRSRLVLGVFLTSLALSCSKTSNSSKHPEELPTPDRELKLADEGFLKEYDNGLTLFVVPDPYTSLVQFDVRQQVGSREDPQGKAGLAHFVEHLMFQMPVDGPGSTRLMLDLPQHSLSFNAYTSADQTHYMHTGSVDELERYMQYTALRLNYDCDAVPESEFMREREVVRNEHRWRGEGLGPFVYSKVLGLVFPEGHPYSRSLSDIDTDLASITPDDACKFIKRYYTAGQADVVVVGDIDPLQVLELANKYLEPLPKVDAPPRDVVPAVNLQARTAQIVAPVKKPTAVVLFEMPKRFSKDWAASQAAQQMMFLAVGVLTNINGTGTVVESLSPAFFGGEEASVFGVAIETKKANQLDQGIDAVLDAISRGFAADVSKDDIIEYQTARQQARLQVLSGISSVLGRANTYADYLEEGERPGFYGGELAAIDALSDEQAQSVGRRVFQRERALIIKVVPDGSKDTPTAERAGFDFEPEAEEQLSLPDDIDPAEAHRPLPFEEIAPAEAEFVEYELESGMRVVLVKSSQVPVMDLQVIVGGGRANARFPDVAQMATQLWGYREDHEARGLATFFSAAGGIFFGDVGTRSTTFRSRGLSIYLDFIIAGVAERVVQADYRTGALEQWRMRMADRFEKKSAVQRVERTNAFYNALFGAGHPHARQEIADRRGLKSVKLRDLEDFRDTHFRAANSAIVITGGFDMSLAMKYIERFFGEPKLRDNRSTWLEPKVGDDQATPPEPTPGDIRVMTEVDHERVQLDIAIAFPLAEVYGKDHAALMVLSNMLNERVSAVRQKLGASYGVYARVSFGRPRLEVGGALDSVRAGDGSKAIYAAIDGVRTGEDFDRLFAFARRNVLRDMLNAQADSELLAGRLAEAVRNGQSYDYFQELARQVANLEPETVKALIDRVMQEKRSVTMIQGPQKGVDLVLEANGITGETKLPDVIHDEDED